MSKTLTEFCNKSLKQITKNDETRKLKNTNRTSNNVALRDDLELVSFSCNDYLGLLFDERLAKAGAEASEKYGNGGGASRLVTGNYDIYGDLEAETAGLYGKDACVAFSSGWAANAGVIPALMGKSDLIVADKFVHNCIISGAKLSGADFRRYKHNNYQNLENILRENLKNHQNCLVISEAVFSMDGDRTDIQKLRKICDRYGAWLMIDFAHEIDFEREEKALPDICMGTYSKGFASLGGYVCADKSVIEYLINKTGSLIFSTALAPHNLAVSFEAVRIAKDEPWRTKKALENAGYFREKISEFMDTEKLCDSETQIVPVVIGENDATLNASKKLQNAGFLVSAIRPPTVPQGSARLRFSFNANHEKAQIDKLIEVLRKISEK